MGKAGEFELNGRPRRSKSARAIKITITSFLGAGSARHARCLHDTFHTILKTHTDTKPNHGVGCLGAHVVLSDPTRSSPLTPVYQPEFPTE